MKAETGGFETCGLGCLEKNPGQKFNSIHYAVHPFMVDAIIHHFSEKGKRIFGKMKKMGESLVN